MRRGASSVLVIVLFALVICGEGGRKLTHNERPPQPGSKTLVDINGESFYLSAPHTYFNWYEAKANCEAMGMQLVTLDTEERWSMISDWLLEHRAFDSWYWSSGQKPSAQLEYVWTTTGKKFDFASWNAGNPNHGPDSDACVNFYAGEGGWDDDACVFKTIQFMCENVPA